MTKFEEVEKAWHDYNTVFYGGGCGIWDENNNVWRRERLRIYTKLRKLCNGNINVNPNTPNSGDKDFAVINGCIMLAEEMRDD